MSCKNCNNKPYTIVHALDLDIDDLASPVDYFIGVRVVNDPINGGSIATPVRIPGEKVLPTGNRANVTAIDANNSSIDIPANQVRAGYIDVQPGGNIVRYADASHAPLFLIVGNYVNDKVLIQTTGFLSFPEGHQYIEGIQYYLGENGQPTTDSSVTGKKLFIPVSRFTLSVNGGF